MPSRLAPSVVLLVVVAAGMAGGYVLSAQQESDDPAAPPAGAAPTTGAASAAPAGVPQQERTGGEPISTEPPAEVASDAPAPPAADGDADVVISFADWNTETSAVEVAGFVGDVVEDGGTCTVTLSRGDVSRTATRAAVADATTTSCGSASVPGEDLSSGTWSAVLSYESSSASGRSAAVDVAVP